MVNVHSTSCTAVLPPAPRVYSIRIGYCMFVFIILPVLWGKWLEQDNSLFSKFVHINCVDKVVDGPHGWCTSKDL